ncbi:GNAT family N-acetyltransferase [Sedimentibacter hydroxybenzoicus DSM 7310]|uniref:GNAT family N-acetyltransferase n=1 Tax=Sedimentibacter hydroxybenzoicus DSM 7310 TaxID=1123245 RepID=A0A974BGT0_SEDHY|nr:GNAT family N-acetyltransferase [Sedimentibacter hydroxybenzoicus]NYB72808.1 GNAT family N-acetyltransferase [Sedimentibacter hydroxybenzoicus DSM 7310]
MINDFIITAVNEETVDAAKLLVVKGLSEYFDQYVECMNPDLEDILASYMTIKNIFLIALNNNKVIGTGALIEESNSVGRIVRMSVDEEYRRKGVATKILKRLHMIAIEKGYAKIVLETTKNWYGAKKFYINNNYIIEREDEENIYFFKEVQ